MENKESTLMKLLERWLALSDETAAKKSLNFIGDKIRNSTWIEFVITYLRKTETERDPV